MSEYSQMVVWLGTRLSEDESSKEIEYFEKWFKETLGFRVKYIKEFQMNESEHYCLLFYIHNEDVPKFAMFRLTTTDMKWFEDFVDNNPNEIPEELYEEYKDYLKN